MEIDLEGFSMQALGQTADWFRRALAVEPVKGNLRLSGYSACGQDGGVQLPREYVEGILIFLFEMFLRRDTSLPLGCNYCICFLQRVFPMQTWFF